MMDEDVRVTCDVTSQRGETQKVLSQNYASQNVRVSAQPEDILEFRFQLSNMTNMELLEVDMVDPQLQFEITELSETESLEKVFLATCCCKAKDFQMSLTIKLKDNITLTETTIRKNVVVIVENNSGAKASPYRNKTWTAVKYVPAVRTEYDTMTKIVRYVQRTDNRYDVPRKLRAVVDKDFNKRMLEPQDSGSQAEKEVYDDLRLIMNLKRNEANYEQYYHHLLWLDEIKELENIEKYNMSGVVLKKERAEVLKKEVAAPNKNKKSVKTNLHTKKCYKLEVPGLSQKRPSLMPGDRAIISLYDPKIKVVAEEHEGYITNIKRNEIFIGDIDKSFEKIFNSNTRFNVRFITNRASLESQHRAVAVAVSVRASNNFICRLFPEPVAFVEPRKIKKFFNPLIGKCAEQKAAVEHILSKTSGLAPYLVFGPPGTGKTMTIVEAIIQILAASPGHRVWVCTNSNMAADHIALQLIKYRPLLSTKETEHKFLRRLCSKDRDWRTMPKAVLAVSNRKPSKKRDSTAREEINEVTRYRIVVTTLLHASKYNEQRFDRSTKSYNQVKVSHLVIDEAAQATEPSCLVPMKLLASGGQLVLAGDPCQLGPVIMSKLAKEFGLGMSLMEHLYTKFSHLYGDDCPHAHQYITMLVNNFRSDADILAIPNEQFYGGKLKALAPLDPLSRISILGKEGDDRSIVFHSVNSKAQKFGKIPSYMNKGELKMVQKYITALIGVHKVPPRDIGVISPYLRQVEVIKEWLLKKKYRDLEVGTVEAFQGKEKRVILVSTVRGGGAPTGDLRADLGFLVDKPRFNVAVTRAKAKLIVIGNKQFLKQDELWNCYIQRCEVLGTSYVESSPALEPLLDNLSIDDRAEPSLSPKLDDLEQDEPTVSPEVDGLEQDEPTVSPELDGLEQDEPTVIPEVDGLEQDEPTVSPELNGLVRDEPTVSPEVDGLERDEPTFSRELDGLEHDESLFSPELDDLARDEASFSPELDDCLEQDEPSFSPEPDCLLYEPSFSPEPDCLLYEPSFSPEPDCLLYEPSFSPEPDCLLYEPSFSPEPDCLLYEPSFSPQPDCLLYEPSFSPEPDFF